MQMTAKAYTLLELNAMVRDAIQTELPESYWVQAELSEARENGGHCYMELIEKDERVNTPVARAGAKCWRNRWMLIRPHFERVTQQRIHAGMKVMLLVHAQFHENYGFSWIVDDIDPNYTMGDMARKRLEIIARLKEEGVFDLQKELELPLFAQRIAVISSENAAGYGDFCNQLADNEYGFQFSTRLFPATMQGEGVEQSIISQLNRINEESDRYDAVVIIRGGGAVADLSGFDTLALAENIANFPLPVITGIGHERDESVLDMISHTRVKTPTAAAAFLIDHLAEVYARIQNAQDRMVNYVSRRMQVEKMRIHQLSTQIPVLFSVVKTRQTGRLDQLLMRMQNGIQRKISNEQHRIQMLESKVEHLDPQLLLQRGYSITLKNGKAVRKASDLQKGDEIETRVESGTFKSIVR